MIPADNKKPSPDEVKRAIQPHDFTADDVNLEARERREKSKVARPPDQETLPPPPPVPHDSGPKKIKITRKDLDRYETTPG